MIASNGVSTFVKRLSTSGKTFLNHHTGEVFDSNSFGQREFYQIRPPRFIFGRDDADFYSQDWQKETPPPCIWKSTKPGAKRSFACQPLLLFLGVEDHLFTALNALFSFQRPIQDKWYLVCDFRALGAKQIFPLRYWVGYRILVVELWRRRFLVRIHIFLKITAVKKPRRNLASRQLFARWNL